MARNTTGADYCPVSPKSVRIVVLGDKGTGKSSLIVAAATDSFPPNVPPVLSDTKLPFEFFPDGVPVTIVDTSSILERVIQTINTLGKEPFNAEPPRSALVSSYVTPVDLFYKRNHGPIPIVDDLNSYFVTLTGLLDNPAKLFMEDIMFFSFSRIFCFLLKPAFISPPLAGPSQRFSEILVVRVYFIAMLTCV